MERTIFLDEPLDIELEKLLAILHDTAKGWDANVRYETLLHPKAFLVIYKDRFAKVRIARQRSDVSYGRDVNVVGFGTTHDKELRYILLNELRRFSIPGFPEPRLDESTVVMVTYIPLAESKLRVVIDSEERIDDNSYLFYIATTYEVLRCTKGMQGAQSWWEDFKSRTHSSTDSQTIEEYLESQGLLAERNEDSMPNYLVFSKEPLYYSGTLTELRAIVDWQYHEMLQLHGKHIFNPVAVTNGQRITVTRPDTDTQVGVIEVVTRKDNLQQITLKPNEAYKAEFDSWWGELCFSLWSDRLVEYPITKGKKMVAAVQTQRKEDTHEDEGEVTDSQSAAFKKKLAMFLPQIRMHPDVRKRRLLVKIMFELGYTRAEIASEAGESLGQSHLEEMSDFVR